jgi:hypothetical protein
VIAMTKPLHDVRQSLAQAPRIFEGLIAAAPTEALTWREAEGTWHAVEILSHLADGEITDWMPRLERILSDGGRFMPFDREGGFVRYRGWTAEALVGEFGQLRRANLDKLDSFNLSEEHLRLTGIHPEFGQVTLEQLLACWATHDLAHIAQISRVLTRSFGRRVGPWRKYFSLLQEGHA